MADHQAQIQQFITAALHEDVQSGDYSSLACIPADARGKALLKVKEDGVLAGIELAQAIFKQVDPTVIMHIHFMDGQRVQNGQVAFEVELGVQALLKAERLVLNTMQRMSAIATLSSTYVNEVAGTGAVILDTRKTTPLFRYFEKWAVRIGGASNHRMGLYDMVMLKDNHIDFAGGIRAAVEATKTYLKEKQLQLPIEVETRTLADVEEVLACSGVDRIMFDNFSIDDMQRAVQLVNKSIETEASGGVNLKTVRSIAETGVDFISVGALTHGVKSIDLSLKASF